MRCVLNIPRGRSNNSHAKERTRSWQFWGGGHILQWNYSASCSLHLFCSHCRDKTEGDLCPAPYESNRSIVLPAELPFGSTKWIQKVARTHTSPVLYWQPNVSILGAAIFLSGVIYFSHYTFTWSDLGGRRMEYCQMGSQSFVLTHFFCEVSWH